MRCRCKNCGYEWQEFTDGMPTKIRCSRCGSHFTEYIGPDAQRNFWNMGPIEQPLNLPSRPARPFGSRDRELWCSHEDGGICITFN